MAVRSTGSRDIAPRWVQPSLPEFNLPTRYGWICPGCGTCYTKTNTNCINAHCDRRGKRGGQVMTGRPQ